MRLEKIKLAGFKSFVEPTTIPVANNLVGIVGPNGCGKSNIIDAVRWVMGEISAKHLRGETMSDVIFNGSSTRKPVSMASVELIFDNQQNRIGLEYANYARISVKRQVARDGQSAYFLNNVRCRRKDITDMFLGTGVGSRSYAIIEQGMISRLVEAKPEELREYLEEAAGISKYKERRRETETRMKRTRENLERLEDLQDEVRKQMSNLNRQAKKAEKYRTLKNRQRQLKHLILILRWKKLEQQHQQYDEKHERLNTEFNRSSSDHQKIDVLLNEEQKFLKNQQQNLNSIQGECYEIGSEISKLEQSIKHLRGNIDESVTERDRLTKQNENIRLDVLHDDQELKQIRNKLETTGKQLAKAQKLEISTIEEQRTIQSELEQWQSQWDQLQEEHGASSRRIDNERVHIENLELQNESLRTRQEKLSQEMRDLSNLDWAKEIPVIKSELKELESSKSENEKTLEDCRLREDEIRKQLRNTQDRISRYQSDLQQTNGKISSLSVLQDHAMGNDGKQTQIWLSEMDLKSAPRLAQDIETETGWEDAVEIALGPYLDAICVKDYSRITEQFHQIANETVKIFQCSPQNQNSAPPNPDCLIAKIKSPWSLATLLSGVYCSDNLAEAHILLRKLKEDESVITPKGIWIGQGWMISVGRSNDSSGILKREKELRSQREKRVSLESELEKSGSVADHLEEILQQLEFDRQKTLDRSNEINTQWSNQKARLSDASARHELAQQRIDQLKHELNEIYNQTSSNDLGLRNALETLDEAEKTRSKSENEKQLLSSKHSDFQSRVQQITIKLRQAQSHVYELKSRTETLASTEMLTEKHLYRSKNQSTEAVTRLKEIDSRIKQSAPCLDLKLKQLEDYKTQRVETDQALQIARQKLDTEERRVTELNERRLGIERQLNTQREDLEKVKVDLQTTLVLRQNIEDQMREMSFDFEDALKSIPENNNEPSPEQQLKAISEAIEQLGSVNLTAVEEYDSQKQRMEFLNRQHQDINGSLETLEKAIRQIDRESKKRLKNTFDNVNKGLQQNFPKLFGGGNATLVQHDENLLESGVAVIARPPGKRNTSIHLLSGGEKALTAVALVFSIFELNPAPFCLLDEVDAPLDDANIRRYTRLVQEMSERIQFLFITHNKVTMEIAENLTGITMNEAGVSRMVSVDVAEAVAMAV